MHHNCHIGIEYMQHKCFLLSSSRIIAFGIFILTVIRQSISCSSLHSFGIGFTIYLLSMKVKEF